MGRLFRKGKLNTCSISQHGQHGKPAAPKLHCPSEFCKFQLVMDFGCPGGRGVLFGIIKQMWHPCGVANMVVYPSWALSPSGYALGWQCSLGVDNHVSNPAGMSYLYIIAIFSIRPDLLCSQTFWLSITSLIRKHSNRQHIHQYQHLITQWNYISQKKPKSRNQYNHIDEEYLNKMKIKN